MKKQHHQECIPSRETKRQPHRKVEQHKERHSTYNRVRQLRNYLRNREGNPAIEPTRILTCLPDISVCNEPHGCGVHELRDQHENEKAGEHARLHVNDAVAELEKGEAVEHGVQERAIEPGVGVLWCAPVLSAHAFGEENCLLES